jgi:rare lipoprotein A
MARASDVLWLLGKEFALKNLFTAKRLAVVIAILSLAMAFFHGIATAQTAEEGIASFYSDKFQGKKTAAGAVYDKNGLTASHKKLPYGTKVRVTNVENGKSVVVTVNDRMRQSNKAVIDVTRRAADELGFAKAGQAKVKLEVEK